MSDFIHDDFLLDNESAKELYHKYAEPMPIVDYHCHLPPASVANDERYDDISQVWLTGDHYKWRAMRSNGIPERLCTGNAGGWEKFQAFANTMPYLLRNPIFHWSHMELKRFFGVSELLTPKSAKRIYNQCNEAMKSPEFSVQGIIRKAGVVLVGTTDDPTDDLAFHKQFAKGGKKNGFQMIPSWRPDRGMFIENTAAWNEWVDKLGASANVDIVDFADYMAAFEKRHAFFDRMGCRLCDHGLETVYAEDYTDAEICGIFAKARAGQTPSADEVLKFKSAMLYEWGVMDYQRGWVKQFHLGAMRNNNTRMFEALGPDTGFDSVADLETARPVARLLDRLDQAGCLAKTVLYNLNPAHNYVIATMLGNFQDGSAPGKMQMGSGWWFLDQAEGMKWQIECLSQLGLLRRFVGMLTDSRSFLSYPRHEYFRRLLCNILGNDMEKGIIPNDMEWVGAMVRDISYNNAATYFGFKLPVLDGSPAPKGRKSK
ncbi:MAG: glucuronate isomerase [Candidatus Sumerlaeia bacterium]